MGSEETPASLSDAVIATRLWLVVLLRDSSYERFCQREFAVSKAMNMRVECYRLYCIGDHRFHSLSVIEGSHYLR